MRTIKKLLIYKFTYDEEIVLKNLKIVNGCGGKGFKLIYVFGLIKWVVKKCKKVNSNKLDKLFNNFQSLCSYTHDIDFYLGGALKDFYKANIRFICGILQLLHWSSGYIRLIVFIILFLGLNTIGLFHFSFRKKKLTLKTLKKHIGKMQ